MMDLAIYFLVGVVAAFLGSMSGLGGGFIAVPALYYLGLPLSSAIAVSKVMVFLNSVVSVYEYSREIRFFPRLYLSVVILMVPMAYLGAYLVIVIPQRLLLILVSIILLATSLRILFLRGERKDGRKGSKTSDHGTYLLGAISGGVAGLTAGLTGLGGGVVNVPAFIYLLNLDIHSSVSLSMACILPSSLSSVIRHAIDEIILWEATIPLSAGALLGGWIGPRVSLKLSGRSLRKIVAAIIAIAVLRILIQAVLG